MFTVSNESELRKKLLEIHDNNDVVPFDSKSVLVLIERISSLVKVGTDTTPNGSMTGSSLGFDSVPSTLRSLLHNISCVLSCKCLGGDMHASTMEIMKLLSMYHWEAKLAIVLASFVVDYAHCSHLTELYKNNPLGDLVAMLNQIPPDFHAVFHETKSTFTAITEASIKVTSIIAEFTKFSTHISNDVQPMAAASYQIPIDVYNIIRVVATCASRLTEILGQSETRETWELNTTFEQGIITIQNYLQTQLNLCNTHIDKEKEKNFIDKLKLKFNKMDAYSNNQKILQLLFNTKDCLLPLAFGRDKTTTVGVEVLKGQTVLLFISDLDISDDDMFILIKHYQESRNKQEYKYEIVWVPIVGKMDEDEARLEQKFKDLTVKMPWHSLLHPGLLKPAVKRFVKEQWHYSKKSMLVALDPHGRVAHLNAFQMVLTWGNTVFPFTQAHESDAWRKTQWSLHLLVSGIDTRISTWIKEKKVICLYGGKDINEEWVDNFITEAREVAKYAEIKLEMVYIGNGRSEDLTEVLANRSHSWEAESTDYFWRRIECMVRSETYNSHHHGARVSTTKENILREVHKIYMVGRQSDQGWALISQGAGLGADKIACGKVNVIHQALREFKTWKVEAKRKDFVTALNAHLVGRQLVPDRPVFCTECRRAFN